MNKKLLSLLLLSIEIICIFSSCKSKEEKYYESIQELRNSLMQKGSDIYASSIKYGYAIWIDKEQIDGESDDNSGSNSSTYYILKQNLEDNSIDTLIDIEPYSIRLDEPYLSISKDSLAIILDQGYMGSILIPVNKKEANIHFPLNCEAINDSVYQGYMIYHIGDINLIQEQKYSTIGVCISKSDSVEVFYHPRNTTETPWFEGLKMPSSVLENDIPESKELFEKYLLSYKSKRISNILTDAMDSKTFAEKYPKDSRHRVVIAVKSIERAIDSDNGEPQWLLVGDDFAAITNNPEFQNLSTPCLILVSAGCKFNNTAFMSDREGLDNTFRAFSFFLDEKKRKALEFAHKVSKYPIILHHTEFIYIAKYTSHFLYL